MTALVGDTHWFSSGNAGASTVTSTQVTRVTREVSVADVAQPPTAESREAALREAPLAQLCVQAAANTRPGRLHGTSAGARS